MRRKEIIVIITAIVLTTLGIKAGDEFIMRQGDDEGCGDGMVFIGSSQGGFCMDVYEASPSDQCPYNDPESQVESLSNFNYRECVPVSQEGEIPWRYITRSQAEELCARAGKRLPTVEEWSIASRGFIDESGRQGSEDCHLNSNWEDQPGPSGYGDNCSSEQGIYDMIGNVWEWVEGDIEDGKWQDRELPESGYISEIDSQGMPIKTSKEENEVYGNDHIWIKAQGIRGIARGGYWESGDKGGKHSFYLMAPPSYAGNGMGFRCVK